MPQKQRQRRSDPARRPCNTRTLTEQVWPEEFPRVVFVSGTKDRRSADESVAGAASSEDSEAKLQECSLSYLTSSQARYQLVALER